MKIFIASDHAGYELKNKVVIFLQTLGITIKDLGPSKYDAGDDYPDYAKLVTDKVGMGEGEGEGILVCDTGIGMSIAANKAKNVRAALVTSPLMAKRAREHNNANILVLGSEINTWSEIEEILNEFITNRFSEEERHIRRLKKIEEIS